MEVRKRKISNPGGNLAAPESPGGGALMHQAGAGSSWRRAPVTLELRAGTSLGAPPGSRGPGAGCPEPRVKGGCGATSTRGGASAGRSRTWPKPLRVPESSRETPHVPCPCAWLESTLGQECWPSGR